MKLKMSLLPLSPNLRGVRRPVVHRNGQGRLAENGEEATRPTRFRKVVCTATPMTALLSLLFFSFIFPALALSLTRS